MRKFYLAIILIFLLVLNGHALPSKNRAFIFDYEVVINDIPNGALEVKVWVPCAAERPYQIIEEKTKDSKWPSVTTHDKKYRNKLLHYTINNPDTSTLIISTRYKIKRFEYSNKPTDDIAKGEIITDSDLDKYLLPSKLVTISPGIKKLAAQITKGKRMTIDKARAIYDYVFENVAYDKIVPGWGKGDTERVCLLKKGNCTDFHSLFISLARASRIPARFIIGVALPKDPQKSTKSYHCWAEFYDAGFGWVPMDISEAWKDKTKYEYYFGTLDENRVEFTYGRDIILEPPQNSEPLNYFLYPYVEVDGETFENVETTFIIQNSNVEGGVWQ